MGTDDMTEQAVPARAYSQTWATLAPATRGMVIAALITGLVFETLHTILIHFVFFLPLVIASTVVLTLVVVLSSLSMSQEAGYG